MMQGILCVKIGGTAVMDQGSLKQLIADVASLNSPVILIHGGGGEVSRISSVFGITPRFVEGIRHTGREEMDVVDMVLSGKLNTYLVRQFHAAGQKAVGLTGSDGALFQGTRIHGDSRTGRINKVDVTLLSLLLTHGYIPVIASTSMEQDGTALNINADEVALAIASSVRAEYLVFLSDIPGILMEGSPVPSLTSVEIEEAVSGGRITGGMIPKVRSSVNALRNGVGGIIIGRYEQKGDLEEFIHRRKGTRITN